MPNNVLKIHIGKTNKIDKLIFKRFNVIYF